MRKIPNTFGIDVTAARFLEYGSEDELRELIAAGQSLRPGCISVEGATYSLLRIMKARYCIHVSVAWR